MATSLVQRERELFGLHRTKEGERELGYATLVQREGESLATQDQRGRESCGLALVQREGALASVYLRAERGREWLNE